MSIFKTSLRQGVGFLGRRFLPHVNQAGSIGPDSHAVSVIPMPTQHSANFDPSYERRFHRLPPSGASNYVFRLNAAITVKTLCLSDQSEWILPSARTA